VTEQIITSQHNSVKKHFINTSSFAQFETYYLWLPVRDALKLSVKIAYFTDVRKARRVLQFEQNHSATLVQWWFYTHYGKEAPTRNSIYKSHK
jgi:hypothetical protein